MVNRCKELLDEFDRAYAERHSDVYGPVGHGIGRSGPVRDSRPTELAYARAVKRSAVLEAWGASVMAIYTACQRLARGVRPKPLAAPDTGVLDNYPPLIQPHEHEALREAQARRTARGE